MARRNKAGAPLDIGFITKPEIALEQPCLSERVNAPVLASIQRILALREAYFMFGVSHRRTRTETRCVLSLTC
jgi:hypothetical protein